MRAISWESAIMRSLPVGKEIQDVTLETIALMDADDAELSRYITEKDTKAEDAEKLDRH